MKIKDLLKLSTDQIRAKGLGLDEATQLLSEAKAEARTIHARADGDVVGDDGILFDELATLAERLKEIVTELEQRNNRALALIGSAARGTNGDLMREGGANGGSSSSDYDRDALREPHSVEDYRSRSGSNPWDMSGIQTYNRDSGDVSAELRGRALSAIEKMAGANDHVRQAATSIVEQFDDKHSALARQVLATSSPAYLRAWSKMAGNRENTLSDVERRALDHVRAMSLTDANGGYLVPFQLDPTVIITANGSQNDIRSFARQVVATGDAWHGVTSGAVSWSWDAEATEVSDDSTTFGQPTIPVHKAQGFVPISIEAIEDSANATAEVAKLLAFGKDDLEAAAFISGTGSGQPKGIVTALAGTGAVMSTVTPETFSLADVHNLRSALPARHRKNGAWLANDLIYSRIRQFDTGGGGGLWEYLKEDRPDRLLGKPVGEAEAMDGAINVAATEANYALLFGNFEQYVIADRVGMSVEFIPHLFGANRRPTGQRGWYAYYRVGADVVDTGAFKVLNVATTA
jgi:HK97 family phage major capsid protein